VFTPAQRSALLEDLVAAAEADPRVVGAGLAGSSARGFTDEFSDIDLALSVTGARGDLDAVVADWTDRIHRDHGALTHLDVWAGATLFRVFLLPGTLQLDVAFWPAAEFGATGPNFRLLFGAEADRAPTPPPDVPALIGMGWLYALHARSSIARGKAWQAEYMISGMRDQVLALACVRHGVPAVQGRGIDDLPAAVTDPVAAGLVRSLDAGELRRAFAATSSARSEERRVGKECRSRWSPYH